MDGDDFFEVKSQARFGQRIPIYAAFMFDAAYIIVDAMQRANSADPAKSLAATPNTECKDVRGETPFDSKGETTLLDVTRMQLPRALGVARSQQGTVRRFNVEKRTDFFRCGHFKTCWVSSVNGLQNFWIRGQPKEQDGRRQFDVSA